jgi:hypothetical protein
MNVNKEQPSVSRVPRAVWLVGLVLLVSLALMLSGCGAAA